MTDQDEPELSSSERTFNAVAPWLGAVVFIASMYYLLERNQEIPLFVFAICGGLMGLGKLVMALKGMKP